MLQFSKIASFLLGSLALFNSLKAQCDMCQTAVRAACHSETSYSICYNGMPTGDYIECPTDFHCTGEKYICYPKGASPSNCRKESDVDVTTKAPRDPVTLCRETQKFGHFPNELDPTCATYVQCILNPDLGEWSGLSMDCPANFWFNGETNYCENKKPENCT